MLNKLISGNNSNPANKTLYCKNLNDKINKKDLKLLLFELFIQHGIIEKITIRGGNKYRGQAFILFQDINSAINAKNSIDGRNILGKPINIEFAANDSIINPKMNNASINSNSNFIQGPKLPQSKVNV
ncbi:U1 small nuclear ribonucleoprotein A [Cryptosporidium ryanae]|uniref:U1 small nuclear ribonucleoprotein A n=1 Tax=Cryptosporidium ryanae TaxID=515981 RepID=UPI00351A1A72|nr:U1 small nuclear ribonucleoprotein A [Cryptosporidium ryanae]